MADGADCLLGFDFGRKRIGVAVGNRITGDARPLKTLAAAEGIDWLEVSGLIEQWTPGALVVGLPLAKAGGEQDMTAAARRFARRLHGRYGRPVYLADERYSSLAADGLDQSSGRDAAAAALILTGYLADPDAPNTERCQ